MSETRNIKDLTAYDKNPRKNAKAVSHVLESLNRHGQVKPIVLSAKGKPFGQEVICAGHTTFEALKRFGAKEVKVVVKEFSDEAQFVDYNIRDNKTGEFAEWDESILEELSSQFDIDLKEMEFEFTGNESDDYLSDVDEDDVPDVPEEPTSKLGQIWKLGEHRLMCGDSREIPAEWKWESVVSDPPYGMSFQSNHRKEKHDNISGDGDEDLLKWACDLPADHSKYLWCRWDNLASCPKPKSLITWVKNNWSMGDLEHEHGRQTEVALFYRGDKHAWPKKRPPDVLEASRSGNELHPTQKPVDLMESVVSWTKGIVFEPFAGSGSTLIACEKLKRKCLAVELSPKYCDVIIKRWEDFTGNKAELVK